MTITPGWFSETLSEETARSLALTKICAVYIDCDLREPAADALDFITPYIQSGTVLILDDWFRNRGSMKEGVQGAVLEWLSKNPTIALQHFYSCDTRTALFIVQMGEQETLPTQIKSV